MGRGSARAAMAVVVAVVVLSCLVFETQAAIYTVGGPSGWTFNTASWPNGKTFKAGDVLVFNYDKTQHNVVQVDRRGYSGCANSPRGAKVLQSGKDRVRLAKGQNYFICSFAGHCQAGMKIAVTAN